MITKPLDRRMLITTGAGLVGASAVTAASAAAPGGGAAAEKLQQHVKKPSTTPKSSGFRTVPTTTAYTNAPTLASDGSQLSIIFDNFVFEVQATQHRAGQFNGSYAFALGEKKAKGFHASLRGWRYLGKGALGTIVLTVGGQSFSQTLNASAHVEGEFTVKGKSRFPEAIAAAYLPISISATLFNPEGEAIAAVIDSLDVALDLA